MEHTAVFEEQVSLTAKDMREKLGSIEDRLVEKLQMRLEGRCSRHGFVKPGSIKLLSRSMGSMEKGRFTGDFIFYLQVEATVLNPADGTVLQGEVIRKNKMGMYVSFEDAIRIIIPRDIHIGNEAFDRVEIGEKVEVEVKKSRFQVNDPYILSVGIFKSSKGKYAGRPAQNTFGKQTNSGLQVEEAADEEEEAVQEADDEEAPADEEAVQEADDEEAPEGEDLADMLAAEEEGASD